LTIVHNVECSSKYWNNSRTFVSNPMQSTVFVYGNLVMSSISSFTKFKAQCSPLQAVASSTYAVTALVHIRPSLASV